MLLSEINIAYYQRLMHGIRDAIAGGTFETFRKRTRAEWARGRHRAALTSERSEDLSCRRTA